MRGGPSGQASRQGRRHAGAPRRPRGFFWPAPTTSSPCASPWPPPCTGRWRGVVGGYSARRRGGPPRPTDANLRVRPVDGPAAEKPRRAVRLAPSLSRVTSENSHPYTPAADGPHTVKNWTGSRSLDVLGFVFPPPARPPRPPCPVFTFERSPFDSISPDSRALESIASAAVPVSGP